VSDKERNKVERRKKKRRRKICYRKRPTTRPLWDGRVENGCEF